MSTSLQHPPPALRGTTPNGDWTTEIIAHQGWTDWRLAQLWRYRDLIALFVWRDFVSVYKQTILGPAWHILMPLLTTITFTVIFGKVAQLPTEGAPPFLFYLTGIVPWTYFASSLTKTSNTFVANANLMGKVYFHRLVIPISIVISNLIAFSIQFGLFLAVLLYFYLSGLSIQLNIWALLSPVLLLVLAGYALGGGIIVSALTTRYRDLANLVTIGVQLLMYATPIIYPASSVPDRYRWLVQLNPLTPIMEGFRKGFLGQGEFYARDFGFSVAFMIVLLTIGMMLFNHIERSFMDTV